MKIRGLARLTGLVLLVVWASQFIDYAAMWMAPSSYGESAAATPLEPSPEDAANAAYTTSATDAHSFIIPSPLSSLPLLCGGLLLIWCPPRLVRFLDAAKSG